MRITQFVIALDNPQAVFYAGQTVTGTVLIDLQDDLDLRYIIIISFSLKPGLKEIDCTMHTIK